MYNSLRQLCSHNASHDGLDTLQARVFYKLLSASTCVVKLISARPHRTSSTRPDKLALSLQHVGRTLSLMRPC